MGKHSKRTAFHAGDFLSEGAVRDILGRRRAPPATPTHAVKGLSADPPTAADEAPSPATRAAPLRRWSVAELVARALAQPSADGTSRS